MIAMCVIAEVKDYQELIAALRARASTHIAGLPSMSPKRIKNITRTSMRPLLGVLGLKLLVVEDIEALDRVRHRLIPAGNARVEMLTLRPHKRRSHSPLKNNRDLARELAKRRAAGMTPWQRKRQARRAAQA